MYFLFRKFWEKKISKKKNFFSKNRFSKKSKMSNCGYTTETFAIVYTLFDAFYRLRADSSQKILDAVTESKKVSTSKCDLQQLFFRGSESQKFGLNRL